MTLPLAICVYCGASSGLDPEHLEAAHTLGAKMAQENIRLIYGAGTIGMMGALSSAAIANGGKVTGIIPDFLLEKEASHEALQDLDTLIITKDMHERKRKMFELADAFIALPGGIGTLEELVEQLTWAQLGQHRKPVLLANINNFWQPLIELISHMREECFIRPGSDVRFLSCSQVEEMLPMLREAMATRSDDDLLVISDISRL